MCAYVCVRACVCFELEQSRHHDRRFFFIFSPFFSRRPDTYGTRFIFQHTHARSLCRYVSLLHYTRRTTALVTTRNRPVAGIAIVVVMFVIIKLVSLLAKTVQIWQKKINKIKRNGAYKHKDKNRIFGFVHITVRLTIVHKRLKNSVRFFSYETRVCPSF